MPTLYIVATPIGNLEDMSLRAIRILNEVDLIASEDTRRTRKLLSAYKINTALISYHEQGNKSKLSYIVERLRENDVAIVSEAGMPGISDPGYDLIQEAIARDIAIIPIPGPSALPLALAVSGLPIDQFTFLGFLPRKKGDRQRLLKSIARESRTIVVFEAPHRLLSSLHDMAEILGEREIAVCRELTKIHEEVFRGSIRDAIACFAEPRGEFTLVIAGCHEQSGSEMMTDSIRDKLRQLRLQGVTAKEAVAQISDTTNLTRRAIYKEWLETTHESPDK